MATDAFGDFAVRPYVKADSGSFGGDLKMPLLTPSPGRRPGDMCLDDAAGSVKVRRGDQSILILGGAGGAPTWAQVIMAGNSSGADIVVNGNIAMTGTTTISTLATPLTLSSGTEIISITGVTPSISFSGSGTISTGAGALTLDPTSGVVNVNGPTPFLTFAAAGTVSTGAGPLTLSPFNGNVSINGTSLEFLGPGTVGTSGGTLTLAPIGDLIIHPSTGIVDFPINTTFSLGLGGSDLIVNASSANSTVSLNGFSGGIAIDFLLNNAHFITGGVNPIVSLTGGVTAVNVTMCNNVAGHVALSTSVTGSPSTWFFTIGFAAAYASVPNVFTQHEYVDSPGVNSPISSLFVVDRSTTGFKVIGTSDGSGSTATVEFSYLVVGS